MVDAPTAFEVQKALAAVIKAKLNASSLAHVIVQNRWILNLNLNESAAALRVIQAGHAERGKIHAWMVGLDGKTRRRPEPSNGVRGAGFLKTVGANRRDLSYTFRVWACHQLDTGTPDENSEKRLDEETDLIADAIDLAPLLRLAPDWIQGHEGLQFGRIGTFKFGETMASVAQGNIVVRLFKPLTNVTL